MNAQNLDRELNAAIALLNEVQKRALLAIVNTFSHEAPAENYHWEDDPKFVAELECRWADYKNGGKTYTSEEVESEVNLLFETFRNQ